MFLRYTIDIFEPKFQSKQFALYLLNIMNFTY